MTILLRILAILFLSALLGTAGVLLHVYRDWQWQELAGLGVGLCCVVLAVLLVRRFLRRRREEAYFRRVLEKEHDGLRQFRESSRLAGLHERWQRGIALLRKSPLGRRGNALYALPWYVVIGETGSGKTTAISQARLAAEQTPAENPYPSVSTHSCEWWFFKRCVVLDTAGRYAIAQDEKDTDEWREFLRLLSSCRSREPLNGVVITLAADTLCTREPEALGEYGRSLRQRMEELGNELGAGTPVYILITKMDLLRGFTELTGLLSETQRAQAAGLLDEEATGESRPDRADSARRFASRFLTHMARRLEEAGCVLAVQSAQPGSTTATGLEFARLGPGLLAFVDGLFASSSYDRAPLLRGMFISSGRQSGDRYTPLLAGLPSLADFPLDQPGTDRPIFLKDFFGTILPHERPVTRFLDVFPLRLLFSRFRPLFFWLAGLLVLTVWFAFSYTRANDALTQLGTAVNELGQPGGAKPTIPSLLNLSNVIRETAANETARLLLRPGADVVETALTRAKQKFVQAVADAYLLLDRDALERTLSGLTAENAALYKALLCEYYAWCNQVLAAAGKGEDAPLARSDTDREVRRRTQKSGLLPVVPQSNPDLQRLFMDYASWEDPARREELFARRSRLLDAELVELGSDMHWVIDWLNTRSSLKPLTMADFWPGSPVGGGVERAYAPQALKRMDELLDMLEAATDNKDAFRQRAAELHGLYADRLRKSWWQMASVFSTGLTGCTQAELWQRVSDLGHRKDNPFFLFIHKMGEAFAGVRNYGTPSAADELPLRFATLLDTLDDKRGGLLSQALQAGNSMIQNKTGLALPERGRDGDVEESLKLLREYLVQLDNLHSAAGTDSSAFLLVHTAYATQGKKGKGDNGTVYDETEAVLNRLRLALDPQYAGGSRFWNLVNGPIRVECAFAISRSACQLNALWNEDVLTLLDDLAPGDFRNTMASPRNPLHAFLDDTAAAFLSRSGKGRVPASWNNVPYPLTKEFLAYLPAAATPPAGTLKESCTVRVSGLPVDVRSTGMRPYKVRLELFGQDGVQELENYNYPVTGDFVFTPARCTGTRLTIRFDDLALTRTWQGPKSFQLFLAEFAEGEKTYTPADFPEQAAELEERRIDSIRVRYSFTGEAEAQALMTYAPSGLPRQPAICQRGINSTETADILRRFTLPRQKVNQQAPRHGRRTAVHTTSQPAPAIGKAQTSVRPSDHPGRGEDL